MQTINFYKKDASLRYFSECYQNDYSEQLILVPENISHLYQLSLIQNVQLDDLVYIGLIYFFSYPNNILK